MTLHKKTLTIICVTLLVMVLIVYGYSRIFFLKSFIDLETETVRGDLQRAISAFSNHISNLSTTAGDYARWDDTYQYIEERNPEYIESNFISSTFTTIKLNMVIVTDKTGHIVYEQGFDLALERKVPLPPSIFGELRKRDLLIRHDGTNSQVAGILLLPEGLFLVASRPITQSDGQGKLQGSLIMGRKLDALAIKRLSLETHMELSFYRFDDPQLKYMLGKDGKRELLKNMIELRPRDEKWIEGYALFRDIYGNPSIVMRLEAERPIYQKGNSSIRVFIIALLVSGLILGFAMVYLLERHILSRMKALAKDVAKVGGTGDLQGRVSVMGKDEISSLAQTINRMLEDLERYQESEERYLQWVNQLGAAHQQLKEMIEFLPDATMVIDRKGRVLAWNQAIEAMTGIPKELMVGQSGHAYAVPFYREARPCLIDLALAEQLPPGSIEHPRPIEQTYDYVLRKGKTLTAEVFLPQLAVGEGAYLMVTASALFDRHGRVTGAIESIRDITEQKHAEERQIYMSVHDSLTGLYNRTYFEQLMAEWDGDRSQPIGLILCDVDGLKVANDTLGHSVGDQLLLAATEVLKAVVGEKDTLARVGGDEFAILLPGRIKEDLETVSLRIREELEAYNIANPQLPLSLSVGYETNQADQDLKVVFKEADNNMYRAKLHHKQSNRSALVNALMKALEARDFITEGHVDRMQGVVARVGLALGLTEHRITDLRLLAQFHDIGKVGIPDRILFKQGPLSSEEYAEMKRHCEIGCRIAQLVPELAPIADRVLKHHERWDGKGYPLGLKEEDIPLDCRIIAIADAYDAMMSDRPYRKALPRERVIAELRRCAGTQFDPNLVELFIEAIVQEDGEAGIAETAVTHA